MQHLFYDWNTIKNKVKDNNLFLFLDYDGTLTLLRKLPEQAILPIKTRKLLESISKLDNCKVAIVSGRSIFDLKQMVKIKNINYIGNHGIEIQQEGYNHKVKQPKEIRYALFETYRLIKEASLLMDGIIVENKKYSLSIHYRLASQGHIRKLNHIIGKIMKKQIELGNLKFGFGKKVIDIKPIEGCNKGSSAIKLLANEKEFIPICIGDDVTDEDMFSALKSRGITIKVGRSGISQAEYFLDSISEVQDFLGYVLEIKKK